MNGDGLFLNYERESELNEQFYLAQGNGNKHYAGAKMLCQHDHAESLGENDKKVATGIGFQVPR